MATAMVSTMALSLVDQTSVPAAGLGGRRPAANCLQMLGRCLPPPRLSSSSSSSSSSWVCRAVPKDEEKAGAADAGPASDVSIAVHQAPKPDTDDQLPASAAPEGDDAPADQNPLAAAASAAVTAPVRDPQQSTSGAAQWYKLYGRAVARGEDARDVFYGPTRPLWKGAFTTPKDVPDYLKGEFPGDYGCDIFKLARLPANYARLRSQELMNGRWAMLGITGCLAPELIHPTSVPGFEPVWFKAGAQIFSESGIDYLGVPTLVNAHSLFAVAVTQAALMGVAEYARVRFVPEGADAFYPGGKTFDPLGLASDPELLAELKVKEIKNGRLAMMAMAGVFAQGAVTGLSPLQNLHDYFHF